MVDGAVRLRFKDGRNRQLSGATAAESHAGHLLHHLPEVRSVGGYVSGGCAFRGARFALRYLPAGAHVPPFRAGRFVLRSTRTGRTGSAGSLNRRRFRHRDREHHLAGKPRRLRRRRQRFLQNLRQSISFASKHVGIPRIAECRTKGPRLHRHQIELKNSFPLQHSLASKKEDLSLSERCGRILQGMRDKKRGDKNGCKEEKVDGSRERGGKGE
nr:hypothetical protein Iba_chr04cCG9660 [Ipomoea batatas]GMC90252.1 hypothetical protein Iba_chr04fCG6340 [Ipomoea batatas]